MEIDGDNGYSPNGGVILATDGNFYGTAEFGGSSGLGVLFRIAPNGAYAVLHEFTGSGDGIFPAAPPLEASDGNLYGTTVLGPGFTGATIYKYARSGTFSTILEFDQTQGASIESPLIQASDGALYGTASSGGTNSCGTLFKIGKSGVLLQLHSFPCDKGGANPNAPVLEASDGNFYGTTTSGGSQQNGTVFRMDKQGAVTVLYNFGGEPTDGGFPNGGLVQATDGNLYGATKLGGEHGVGTLYQISTSGVYKMLYSFDQSKGQSPSAALLQHTNGILYGTASLGGTYGFGAIYSLDVGLRSFITFVRSTGKVGQTAQILGTGLTGATSIAFDGLTATSFKVVSDTYMTAVVPPGATTGPVVVTTPGGKLTSNVSFRITK